VNSSGDLARRRVGRSSVNAPAAARRSAEIIYLDKWRKFERSPDPEPEPLTPEHWLIGLVMLGSFAGAILALL
jgi:hypothetical protein